MWAGNPFRPLGAARHPFARCRGCTLQTLPGLFLGSPKFLLLPLRVSRTPALELRKAVASRGRQSFPWVEPGASFVPGSTPVCPGSGWASSALWLGRLFMRRISSFLKGQRCEWDP